MKSGATAAILTSKITNANLLGGVIKAHAIVAQAKAVRTGGTLTRSSSGTSIGDLTINGQKQSGNQPANTKFAIPGIGKLVKAERKARIGRNPQTGEAIKIKAKTVVKFRIAKAAKDTIAPPKK